MHPSVFQRLATTIRLWLAAGGCFLHTAANENVAGFYRYLQGDRMVFELRYNNCANYDLAGALKAKDGQVVTCPGCGAGAAVLTWN